MVAAPATVPLIMQADDDGQTLITLQSAASRALLGLILHGMWYRPMMLQHLSQVAHVQVAPAVWALHEVVCLAFGLPADALAYDLATPQRSIGISLRHGAGFRSSGREVDACHLGGFFLVHLLVLLGDRFEPCMRDHEVHIG